MNEKNDVTKLPKTILFDLDDTIIAFTEGAEPTWRTIAHQFADKLSGTRPAELLEALNNSRSSFWADPERHREGRMNLVTARRRITASALATLDCTEERLSMEMADTYDQLREESIRLFPGAIETLVRLTGKGIRLALVTNGSTDTQRAKIDRFNLAQYFEVILIEGEFGLGKPDERVYVEVLARLGVRPEDAWMVGDNLEWDVEQPQRLGLTAIWVDFADEGLPRHSTVTPDRTIRSISELEF